MLLTVCCPHRDFPLGLLIPHSVSSLAMEWKVYPPKKQAVYQFYDFRLLRIHDQIAVLPFIIAEKPAVWHADLAVSKPFLCPYLTFSEMLRFSYWAKELMIVMSGSPLASNVQIFSFSK